MGYLADHPDELCVREWIDGKLTSRKPTAKEIADELANEPTLADLENARVTSAINDLWQAAHDYEFKQISGSAIGLLALGVGAALPKALAVQGWIHSIWSLYYERKDVLEAGGSVDVDFSSCGEIPYSVPDLMAESGF